MCTTLRLKFRSMTYVFRRVRKTEKKKHLLSSSCLSVRPSARNKLAPTGRIFIKFWNRILRKSVEKFAVSLKSDKNNGQFKRTRYVYLWHLAELSSEWGMFQTEAAEEIKTCILCSIIFRKSCSLWDNVEKFCSYSQTGHRRRHNTAHALTMLDKRTFKFVILTASPRQQW